MLLNCSSRKKISICILIFFSFLFTDCEYYKAYKYNEQGIQELSETKLADSRTSFHKSISYSYKSFIPTYNIGNILMQEDDLPAAHEKFQQAIEANPEFKEALYNDGQALFLWGKKELSPETCNVERAQVLWEQSINRFKETAELVNVGDYKKPSLDNADFIANEISKLEELKENNCQNQESEKEKKEQSDSDQTEDGEKKESKNNQANNDDRPQDGKDSKDKNESGKDGKDSKDKDKSGKDGKDSKDKNESGKDGKDSKDKNESGKDGKDSKDKDKSGNDGKDSKDKDKNGVGNEQENENQLGDNGYLPEKDGGPRKEKSLTPDEEKRLQKEMERIQKRSGESKNHKRSRHQQEKKNKDHDELEQGLKDALW